MERINEEGAVRVLPSGLISRKDFAEFVGRSVGTIAQWACQGRGPKPVRIEGRTFYRFDDVRSFVREGERP